MFITQMKEEENTKQTTKPCLVHLVSNYLKKKEHMKKVNKVYTKNITEEYFLVKLICDKTNLLCIFI